MFKPRHVICLSAIAALLIGLLAVAAPTPAQAAGVHITTGHYRPAVRVVPTYRYSWHWQPAVGWHVHPHYHLPYTYYWYGYR